MIKTLFSNLTNSRIGIKLAKKSPEILLVVGVVGIVGSTVLACQATLKCQEIMTDAQEKLTCVKAMKEKIDEGKVTTDVYNQQDYQKDLAIVYVQTSVNLLKLYGPAVALGMASISCLVGSHRIMQTRNVALMAAYKTIHQGFTAYRDRVKKDLGEEKDYMYKHGLEEEIVVETETDAEGKTKKTKKKKMKAGEEVGPSSYARFFDEFCTQWTKEPEYNLMYLKGQQNYLNDMLRIRGHVFLNEVYDAIGVPRSQAGSIIGWVRNEEYPDSFVDFGIFDGERPRARDFVNGHERSILLDFNVDGVIYDLI